MTDANDPLSSSPLGEYARRAVPTTAPGTPGSHGGMTAKGSGGGGGSEVVAIVPVPRVPIMVRQAVPGVAGDLGFIDQLQKMHSHMVGWSPTKQLEKNIADGYVLIAEATQGSGAVAQPDPRSLHPEPARIGYCIARDQYMKRDDVGIVYQLNVLPLRQRHLVGAALIRAVFERAAYGCRLFSCWCAQDLQANYFWESIGFVPLAFRTGSRSKQRIHIFWQRRVREDDDVTPYWYPSQTSGGAVAEDRLVLPIPPGTHWRDAKPVVLPGMEAMKQEEQKMLPGGSLVVSRPASTKMVTRAQAAAIARGKSAFLSATPAGKAAIVTSGGVRYVERADAPQEVEQSRPKRERKPRQKHESEYVAAARELRDRFLERVNVEMQQMLPGAQGKYDVSRLVEGEVERVEEQRRLTAA